MGSGTAQATDIAATDLGVRDRAVSPEVRSGSGRIRPFAPSDVGEVADIWMRCYRGEGRSAPDHLSRYFEKIYFESPWQHEDIRSLVFESPDGRILGFSGVAPRRCDFKGKRILLAVRSGILVDPAARGRGIGQELVNASLEGPQAATFTDGANSRALPLWQRARGSAGLLYGFEWTRVLRPAGNLQRLAQTRLGRLSAVSSSVARVADAVLRRLDVSPITIPKATTERRNAASDEIFWARKNLECRPALSVVETSSELEWVLADMRGACGRGSLEAAIVARGSRVLGWHIHFARPDGVSQVVQFGGTQESIDDVFADLLCRAAESGALALSGALDPRYIQCLTKQGCTFRQSYSFLLHTRNSDIRYSLAVGDSNITRMNGEWWMHFTDGPW